MKNLPTRGGLHDEYMVKSTRLPTPQTSSSMSSMPVFFWERYVSLCWITCQRRERTSKSINKCGLVSNGVEGEYCLGHSFLNYSTIKSGFRSIFSRAELVTIVEDQTRLSDLFVDLSWVFEDSGPVFALSTSRVDGILLQMSSLFWEIHSAFLHSFVRLSTDPAGLGPLYLSKSILIYLPCFPISQRLIDLAVTIIPSITFRQDASICWIHQLPGRWKE